MQAIVNDRVAVDGTTAAEYDLIVGQFVDVVGFIDRHGTLYAVTVTAGSTGVTGETGPISVLIGAPSQFRELPAFYLTPNR